ncbi:MAG: pantoate--beta-alanine ligase [Armatimonadota bacterium]
MEVAKRIEDLRRIIPAAKKEGRTVGLVPTMGALHAGHLSLIKNSKDHGDFTVVSVFVNPTQFGPNEDFERYPRPIEADIEKCREAGVDVVFTPTVDAMYPEGFDTYVNVGGVTGILEGAARPGHFRGVATVVLKLFTAVEPTRAYFGMKDYQQLKVLQKMVRDLNVNVEIVPVPIFREPDGLAMSSRNAYLKPDERQAALVLYRALNAAKEAVLHGTKDSTGIYRAASDIIEAEPLAKIDYVAVIDPETLEAIEKMDDKVLVALAVRIGSVRLIDNMLIGGNN